MLSGSRSLSNLSDREQRGLWLLLFGTLAAAPFAEAFKVDTHMWIADQILSELEDTPPGQAAPLRIGTAADGRAILAEVPGYVRDAIVDTRTYSSSA